MPIDRESAAPLLGHVEQATSAPGEKRDLGPSDELVAVLGAIDALSPEDWKELLRSLRG